MPKNPVTSEHHQPRDLDRKKRHRAGFSEDVQEKRLTRVSFKNYVRQLREEEFNGDVEQWVVEKSEDEMSVWAEIAGPFTNEEDAYEMMDELLETAESNEQYRITRLEE